MLCFFSVEDRSNKTLRGQLRRERMKKIIHNKLSHVRKVTFDNKTTTMNISSKSSKRRVLNYDKIPLLGILLLGIIIARIDAKVHMEVYYETFCPDSMRFLKLLAENYEDIENKITLELVPFGKAKVSLFADVLIENENCLFL